MCRSSRILCKEKGSGERGTPLTASDMEAVPPPCKESNEGKPGGKRRVTDGSALHE